LPFEIFIIFHLKKALLRGGCLDEYVFGFVGKFNVTVCFVVKAGV
jgi:hypothetical protein